MKERISETLLNGQSEQQSTSPVCPPIDLDAIENMDAIALRGLVKRMACQCGMVASMSKEETAQAMLDVLAETALKPIVMGLNMKADILARMNAIDKWLDRTEGKATQRIEQKVQHIGNGIPGDMTTAELMMLVSQLPSLPAGIKLLPDGKLDVVDASYEDVTTE